MPGEEDDPAWLTFTSAAPRQRIPVPEEKRLTKAEEKDASIWRRRLRWTDRPAGSNGLTPQQQRRDAAYRARPFFNELVEVRNILTPETKFGSGLSPAGRRELLEKHAPDVLGSLRAAAAEFEQKFLLYGR